LIEKLLCVQEDGTHTLPTDVTDPTEDDEEVNPLKMSFTSR